MLLFMFLFVVRRNKMLPRMKRGLASRLMHLNLEGGSVFSDLTGSEKLTELAEKNLLNYPFPFLL